jgi:hypothetical protein
MFRYNPGAVGALNLLNRLNFQVFEDMKALVHPSLALKLVTLDDSYNYIKYDPFFSSQGNNVHFFAPLSLIFHCSSFDNERDDSALS